MIVLLVRSNLRVHPKLLERRWLPARFASHTHRIAQDARLASALLLRVELQRDGVDAVAQPLPPGARTWAVLEDVTEVRTATRTMNLDTRHSMRSIGFGLHGRGARWLREARPTAARIVFRLRAEQLGLAADASIRARVVTI